LITSVRNIEVQRTRKLLKRSLRNEARQFLAEGPEAVLEALAAKAPVHCVFLDPDRPQSRGIAQSCEAAGVRICEAAEPVMRSISRTVSPPGVVAVCGFVDVQAAHLTAGGPRVAVVLSDVRDPGNAGTILRTCRAVGVDAVFVGRSSVDIYNAKLVRASAGALFNLRIARDVEIPWILDELGRLGVKRIAADPRGKALYDNIDMTGRVAFILGNEAWGFPAEMAKHVDARAAIPMAGTTESLNVAVAAAVLLFEAARQRRAK